MAQQWTAQFSYVTGVVRDASAGALALVYDDLAAQRIEHTVPLVWSGGQWLRTSVEKLDFATVSMTIVQKPFRQAAYLGAHGHVYFVGAGAESEELIITSTSSPQDVGMMRSIRCVAGETYAVGERRQAYRRVAAGQWECVGNAPNIGAREGASSFEAIDGFSRSELYAAGQHGELWLFDGSRWTACDSPTNVTLTDVCCATDGQVYICGSLGTLLVGRGAQWRIVEHGVTGQNFWSVRELNGRMFLSTADEVFHVENNTLQAVDFGGERPQTCFHLSGAADALWSVGPKDVLAFNGTQWSRID
jgi:hypothetical protein